VTIRTLTAAAAVVALVGIVGADPAEAAGRKRATASAPAPVADAQGYVPLRKGQRIPDGVDRVLVVNRKGVPLRSRRAVVLREYKVRPGDTVRTVAYRFSTAPLSVAKANGLQWDPAGTPLPEGEKVKVPVRYRPASGFSRAVRLKSGPGVRSERRYTTWGRPYVVALLKDAFRAMHRLWPGRHPGIVGSLSRLGGGRLRPHKSHRAGRDIDIGYFTFEAERKYWGAPRLHQIDYARLWFFIDRLERSGQLAAIYMSPRIQYRLHRYALTRAGAAPERLNVMFQYPCARGARKTLIRHSRGHRDHMHIRFDSPEDLSELSS